MSFCGEKCGMNNVAHKFEVNNFNSNNNNNKNGNISDGIQMQKFKIDIKTYSLSSVSANHTAFKRQRKQHKHTLAQHTSLKKENVLCCLRFNVWFFNSMSHFRMVFGAKINGKMFNDFVFIFYYCLNGVVCVCPCQCEFNSFRKFTMNSVAIAVTTTTRAATTITQTKVMTVCCFSIVVASHTHTQSCKIHWHN